MERRDLNDHAYFVAVVTHGGFSAASRALHEPKSKLSRRIADLETRLGARLIERSSRRFRVTELGQAFYERCRAMLEEAEAAEAIVSAAQAEPAGIVRFSCPTGMVTVIGNLITGFLDRHPKVRLQLLAVDRPVDLVDERIDLALRVRLTLTSDAALTMRTLGHSVRILVAHPRVAVGVGTLSDLAASGLLTTSDEAADCIWPLMNRYGETHEIRRMPRFGSQDMAMVRDAAIAGLGVAWLPDHFVREALTEGRLVQVLPEWTGPEGIVHLVFTTRRGLPSAVRAFIDHLAAGFPKRL
ncbi:LysR substrate-binding domain-containing protein [Tanticharoenia sakaeratensis]|uniref:LysR family transcriptional regulator n=1 Tax=Tanticharoenia sakaeratensis NBRC 103193 TaxID=1231623 RepID=A0A0D6MN96_9PROT|nr:LysR substrate-binding domain-containing protein [Tanticharoenia sakaeratensis]GAN55172.1 LysR family transcriptional regulator [Tanticharoenia sakaeratensis NBRC 103193]GBQ24922.1 LysR family transcriptional regulator [Tanticharoenia sakaeratensis NBRC 103193]